MPLEIVVCIKQVPHPDYFPKIQFDHKRGTIIREGIPAIINPLDRHALEEALRIKERFSGRVIAFSMGPYQAKEALEEALAMGADEAILLCDKAFAGADTLATAYTLSCAIKKLGRFDLILCGNESIDSGTSQVGPQLAEFLDIPSIIQVKRIDFVSERSLIVIKSLEYGYLKIMVALPALLAVIAEINKPRLPTVTGIMEALKKEIKVWGSKDIGAEEEKVGILGSPTRVIGIEEFKVERRREIFQGTPQEVVRRAVKRLWELGAL